MLQKNVQLLSHIFQYVLMYSILELKFPIELT